MRVGKLGVELNCRAPVTAYEFGALAGGAVGRLQQLPVEASAKLSVLGTDGYPHLRGYAWITVVSAGVAEILGGAEAVMEAEAFDEVVVLPSGALWLEAAPDLPPYDEERQRRVFETIARVLPPGVPVRDRRAQNRRLVQEDAAEAAGSAER